MSTPFIISFENGDGTFQVWDSASEEITTEKRLPEGNDKLRKFIMLKQKEHEDNYATDECLAKYAKRFKVWCKELLESDLKIDYMDFYSDYTAVTRNFNRFCQKYYKGIHKPISTTEHWWFERCPNFGIQYLDEKVKGKTVKCYSSDFKNQYGSIFVSDLMIPKAEGQETILKKLPKRRHLEAGFYRVKITSDNEHFRKMFAFSKYNVYVKESLEFAMLHDHEYDVNIELIQDGKPNAYLYDEDDMVPLKGIAKTWFRLLSETREKLKGNKLIKHLISSAWGHLNAHNYIYKSWDEIEAEELDVSWQDGADYKILEYRDYGNRDRYKLLDTKSPYKHNIRLKPWITAVARNLTASIVLTDPKRVIRVQTDSVSFTREQDFDDYPNFVPEDKTTGKIYWKHCNSYKNITTGYCTRDHLPKE
jgi:hypothetical protein